MTSGVFMASAEHRTSFWRVLPAIFLRARAAYLDATTRVAQSRARSTVCRTDRRLIEGCHHPRRAPDRAFPLCRPRASVPYTRRTIGIERRRRERQRRREL